jgi:hypothetical protein
MRGFEYLSQEEEFLKIKTKKEKPSAKKSNHKHEYVINKIINDSMGSVRWEKIFSECSICGKTKEEFKHNTP